MPNNIKFNDRSLFVSYIQTFLKENYSNNVLPTNVYDSQTHEALINYLDQPNVVNMIDAEDGILEKFDEFNTMFTLKRGNDTLTFTAKTINKNVFDFIELYFQDIKDYIESIGWEISTYSDYVDYLYDLNGDQRIDNVDKSMLKTYIEIGSGLTEEQINQADFNLDGSTDMEDYNMLVEYIDTQKPFFVFKKQDRENYFPNKDMLKFINLFSNDFYFYKAIRDGKEIDDKVHDNLEGIYKICVIKCKPGTTYTIAHSSSITQRLVIGSMVTNKRNLEVSKLQNVVDIMLPPGTPTLYTTSSANDGQITSRDAQYILIQCSSNIEDYSGLEEVSIPLMLGDINMDGKIDNVDRRLLADYLYYPEGDPNRPTLTRKQLAACNINNRKDVKPDGTYNDITNEDLEMLIEYLNGDIPTLGTIEYKYYVPKEVNELNNVASLLVIEGDQTEVETGEIKECEVQILHEEQTTTLKSQYFELEGGTETQIKLDYEESEIEGFDEAVAGINIEEIRGNTSIEYYDKSNRISPTKPAESKSLTDLIINVNDIQSVVDLSNYKLRKIGTVYDRLFQQNGAYIYNKRIDEIQSTNLYFTRQSTTNGFTYYRSSVTIFNPTSNNQVAEIFSNKFEIVSADDILNQVFTYDYEMAVDRYGRILLFIYDLRINELEADGLAWINRNPFYIIGKLKTESLTEIGSTLSFIEMDKDKANIVSFTSDTCSPSLTCITAELIGRINAYIETNMTPFPCTKSSIGLDFASFTNDPWIVHHKFIPYLLGQAITPYSRTEEITYLQNLIGDIYPEYKNKFVAGEYSELLRSLVEKFQRSYVSYGKGDLNVDGSINKVDINLLEKYLDGSGTLSDTQLNYADVNNDTVVNTDDLNMMYKEYRGINDTLKTFDIDFIFGWLDPQTEFRMERLLNDRLYKSKHMIGWNDQRPG